MPLRKRDQILGRGTERDRYPLVLFEVEPGDPQFGIQFRHHARSPPGHEEHLPFVVLKPGLDLLRTLHRIGGGVVELREGKQLGEALAIAVGALQRGLELRAELHGVFGKAAELLKNQQPLRPQLPLHQRVGQQTEERIRLAALFCFAQGLRDPHERGSIGGIPVDLAHPERFQLVEFLLFDELRSVFSKPQRR
jgi:hypothetical protein